ncbi:MAG TPA: helix-turn-helix domain-containing protein [Pyrinomonadaceae bacterium]|jgi:DNA-binding MarR family transcriptional regulator
MNKVAFDSYIIDPLMRDLVGHEQRPSAFIVFLYLWARTNGMRTRALTVSLQEIADDTGLSKTAVQTGLKLLKRRRLIRSERASPTSRPTHYILSPWRRVRSAR